MSFACGSEKYQIRVLESHQGMCVGNFFPLTTFFITNLPKHSTFLL